MTTAAHSMSSAPISVPVHGLENGKKTDDGADGRAEHGKKKRIHGIPPFFFIITLMSGTVKAPVVPEKRINIQKTLSMK